MAIPNAAATPIRVLLADDHESVREDLRARFAARAEFAVLHETDRATAVKDAVRSSPDVVVLDLSVPANGLDALRRLKQVQPHVAVVMLSRHREPAYVREALAAGADGYVLKQSPFDVLLDAVHAASRGERLVDPAVAPEPVPPGHLPPLSARELEVLRGAAAGQSNKSIAERLRISFKTVEAHKANGMHKLGLKDRSDLVRFALHAGWFTEV